MPVDLSSYEQLGDLDEPFELSAKDEHRQRDRQRLRDSTRCEITPLTFEQYRAGQPCPGCGRPYIDDEPFESKGTMYFTDAERARHDAEEARFKAAHRACGSHRHSVSGSLTTHCGKCCPFPPLSPAQLGRLSSLMSRKTAPHELMIWKLRLYCGHTVERQAHYSHRTVHAAFTGSIKCAGCGCDPATIVDARAIGLVEQPTQVATEPVPSKPTRAALERRVRDLEAQIARLQQAAKDERS